MSKVKLKVTRVTSTANGLHSVSASNAHTTFVNELVDLKGKKLTEAQASKLKPNEYRRNRVRTGDQVSIVIITKTEYKVGQDITVSF